ncbi:phosphoribosyltransferase [Caldimonas sp. KR1-144]|uniref:phosphoribosyltransferase n=1 Tax=Caldimonas sp. KR1-144 TaxID=3400911 RepID=UPI003C0471AA
MFDAFADRAEAGRLLAAALRPLQLEHPVVIALPRGGVPVAAEVARELQAPLDLILVRKIGAPTQPELAVAAIVDGEPPQIVRDATTMAMTGADEAYVQRVAAEEQRENLRRRQAYLHGRAPLPLAGRTAILVDDGIATGTTVRAALAALRQRGPARLVLAVPVAPPDTVAALRGAVDELVCLRQPGFFHAVGVHYADFHQVEDREVVDALDAYR